MVLFMRRCTVDKCLKCINKIPPRKCGVLYCRNYTSVNNKAAILVGYWMDIYVKKLP